jgi:hypothetical protein
VTEEIFLAPAEAVLYLESRVHLQVEHQLETDVRVKPFWSVTYDVEDYHVVDGLPVADTALGIGVPVEATVYAMSASMTPGEIFSEGPPNVVSRWLPVDGTYDDPTQWSAAVGSRRLPLYTDNTTPVLDTSYDYVRDGFSVPGAAMRLAGEDYFITDGLAWAASSFAVVVVAVLKTPLDDVYGVLETFPQSGADPDRPFVSLRYSADGAVTTHSLGPQNTRQTTSQGLRTGQPIIVGFMLALPKLLTTVIVDRHLTATDIQLADAHPQDAQLYVGRSPVLAQGGASMDILEVDYFENLTRAELLNAVSVLDGLYGVSS